MRRTIEKYRPVKRYTFRFNQHNPDSVYSFHALQDGSKKVETRAASGRYQSIRVGDKLIFTCGSKRIEKVVKRVTTFKSIDAMLRKYRVSDIMPSFKSRKELHHAYLSYKDYGEKIKKFGIIAMLV